MCTEAVFTGFRPQMIVTEGDQCAAEAGLISAEGLMWLDRRWSLVDRGLDHFTGCLECDHRGVDRGSDHRGSVPQRVRSLYRGWFDLILTIVCTEVVCCKKCFTELVNHRGCLHRGSVGFH